MKQGVIVITKTDLAEPEFLDLVEEDIMEAVEGTFLEHAPVIRTSAYTAVSYTHLDVYKRQTLDTTGRIPIPSSRARSSVQSRRAQPSSARIHV